MAADVNRSRLSPELPRHSAGSNFSREASGETSPSGQRTRRTGQWQMQRRQLDAIGARRSDRSAGLPDRIRSIGTDRERAEHHDPMIRMRMSKVGFIGLDPSTTAETLTKTDAGGRDHRAKRRRYGRGTARVPAFRCTLRSLPNRKDFVTIPGLTRFAGLGFAEGGRRSILPAFGYRPMLVVQDLTFRTAGQNLLEEALRAGSPRALRRVRRPQRHTPRSTLFKLVTGEWAAERFDLLPQGR